MSSEILHQKNQIKKIRHRKILGESHFPPPKFIFGKSVQLYTYITKTNTDKDDSL